MKNSLKKFALAALTIAAIAPTLSQAADGTITFDGEIVANTCTITGNGVGKDFTVTLPKVQTSALATDGQTAGTTKFTMKLSACTPASGNVSMYFEPDAKVDLTTGRLKNASGTAKKVQVGLLNADFSNITLGNAVGAQNSQKIAITAGASAETVYWAQYVATGGAAEPGTVKTSTMYSMIWD